MTRPKFDPALQTKLTAAIAACDEQFSAMVTAHEGALVACGKKMDVVVSLCNEAMTPLSATLAAAVDVCQEARSSLLIVMRAAQRDKTSASVGTAQREYAAAFEPFRQKLGAAYFAYNTASGPISATLSSARDTTSYISESLHVLRVLRPENTT